MRVESAQCVVCSTLPVLKFKAGITNTHRTGKIRTIVSERPGASPPAPTPCPEAAEGLTAPPDPSCIEQ